LNVGGATPTASAISSPFFSWGHSKYAEKYAASDGQRRDIFARLRAHQRAHPFVETGQHLLALFEMALGARLRDRVSDAVREEVVLLSGVLFLETVSDALRDRLAGDFLAPFPGV
jgi:hypothetical protein